MSQSSSAPPTLTPRQDRSKAFNTGTQEQFSAAISFILFSKDAAKMSNGANVRANDIDKIELL